MLHPYLDERDFQNEEAMSDDPKCRDDLCTGTDEFSQLIDEADTDAVPSNVEFNCPPGYVNVNRGGMVFCRPKESETKPKADAISERQCKGTIS